ncbi:MAG: GNAT family N-acetyltransferase, partial [Deltaproteobacteria bacterium]|nr:GNAT family N-acetyltransferase [Deltaproteobacteria bacterium]
MTALVRKAKPKDLDSIYLMGIDVWSDGNTKAEYLFECRNSPKYKKGEWFVLVDSQDNPVSSLITYTLTEKTIGIGSIATPQSLRKRGYASELIR